jgi:hypothetical protein
MTTASHRMDASPETPDFHAFVRHLARHDYEPMLIEIITEIERVRSLRLTSANGASYLMQLKQLLFFLANGARPGGVLLDDWHAYKHLTEALVDRGRFSPDALEIFEHRGPHVF